MTREDMEAWVRLTICSQHLDNEYETGANAVLTVFDYCQKHGLTPQTFLEHLNAEAAKLPPSPYPHRNSNVWLRFRVVDNTLWCVDDEFLSDDTFLHYLKEAQASQNHMMGYNNYSGPSRSREEFMAGGPEVVNRSLFNSFKENCAMLRRSLAYRKARLNSTQDRWADRKVQEFLQQADPD